MNRIKLHILLAVCLVLAVVLLLVAGAAGNRRDLTA